jgi:hypothetical protein
VRYGGPNDKNHKPLYVENKPENSRLPPRISKELDKELLKNGVETRAAVALLSRSIRIVSEGDTAKETFDDASKRTECSDKKTSGCYYYGAHMVIRQGFRRVQIRGVEFKQMGQGGRLGHYPVHFHMARTVPLNTYIKDSSINESMTRWIVLHSTQGVTVARNVGYKSIGHGFYLEDGTETDNNFFSNIGIFARAAIKNPQNPREVPGIFAWDQPDESPPGQDKHLGFPYRSDAEYPTVFWITNGWNNFVGNMAAGAGACGAAYWLVPFTNTDRPDVPVPFKNVTEGGHMKWDYDDAGHFGYAGLQSVRNSPEDRTFGGTTPLKTFYMNYATTAMMSFQTTPDAPPCNGFIASGVDASTQKLPTISEVKSISPKPAERLIDDPYYPHAIGARAGTICPFSDNRWAPTYTHYNCGIFSNNACAVTVIDHFTSSFTWAEGNVAAVWLRPQWYLLVNSVISDVQNGGVNFVTGGDFTQANTIPGLWQVAKSTIFIGHTQPQDKDHGFALDYGPFNYSSQLKCDALRTSEVPPYCLSTKEGISMPAGGLFTNQRLFSIYDGPNYEDSNAFLDITRTNCPIDGYLTDCMYGQKVATGVLKDQTPHSTKPCYLPNAAIAWKQPNGFFYPPAFHSTNLFFDNVELRHYVINPLVLPVDVDPEWNFGQGGSYITDSGAAEKSYCHPTLDMFGEFTSIDRQTELNDDDGSLTGLSNTISINEDKFFGAPIDTPECASSIGANSEPTNACNPLSNTAPPPTARTSPYDYVATVIYHPQWPLPSESCPGGYGTCQWDTHCTDPGCYGVPLYRQFLTAREWTQWKKNDCGTAADRKLDSPKCRWPFIRMAGMDLAVRETLTINNGTYYLDTTVPYKMQDEEKFFQNFRNRSYNTFAVGETYYVFFVYAKKTTKQTYQIYLGEKKGTDYDIKAVQVKIPGAIKPEKYTGSSNFLTVDNPQHENPGVVSVTVDFSSVASLTNGLCQPASFCKAGGATGCQSALTTNSPFVEFNHALVEESKLVCSNWAVKDLDCPKDGCLGFSFTIPDGFVADAKLDKPTPHRPFPKSFPDWHVKFAPGSNPGQCKYPKIPGTDPTCPVP